MHVDDTLASYTYFIFFIEEKVRKEIKIGTVRTLLRELYNGVLDNLNRVDKAPEKSAAISL